MEDHNCQITNITLIGKHLKPSKYANASGRAIARPIGNQPLTTTNPHGAAHTGFGHSGKGAGFSRSTSVLHYPTYHLELVQKLHLQAKY